MKLTYAAQEVVVMHVLHMWSLEVTEHSNAAVIKGSTLRPLAYGCQKIYTAQLNQYPACYSHWCAAKT